MHTILNLSANTHSHRFFLLTYGRGDLFLHRPILAVTIIVMFISTKVFMVVLVFMMSKLMSCLCSNWYIQMFCGVSYWFVINVGCGMLNWLVINMSLHVFHWFVLSMSGIVLFLRFWSIVMWCHVAFRFNWDREVSELSVLNVMVVMMIFSIIKDMFMFFVIMMTGLFEIMVINLFIVMMMIDFRKIMNIQNIMMKIWY